MTSQERPNRSRTAATSGKTHVRPARIADSQIIAAINDVAGEGLPSRIGKRCALQSTLWFGPKLNAFIILYFWKAMPLRHRPRKRFGQECCPERFFRKMEEHLEPDPFITLASN